MLVIQIDFNLCQYFHLEQICISINHISSCLSKNFDIDSLDTRKRNLIKGISISIHKVYGCKMKKFFLLLIKVCILKLNNFKRICIIGLGYVGLPLALEFSKYFKVLGVDIDKSKIKTFKKVQENMNLQFETKIKENSNQMFI